MSSLCLHLLLFVYGVVVADISIFNSRIFGPGLKADFQMPVRYFYLQTYDTNGKK